MELAVSKDVGELIWFEVGTGRLLRGGPCAMLGSMNEFLGIPSNLNRGK